MNEMSGKDFFQSKTTQAFLVLLFTFLAPRLGLSLVDPNAALTLLIQGAAVMHGLVGIITRKQPITSIAGIPLNPTPAPAASALSRIASVVESLAPVLIAPPAPPAAPKPAPFGSTAAK